MIYERVKYLSDKRKLSLNQVEEQLGYSKNTLYRLKNQMPGSEKLKEIADFFNVSTDYLLGRESNVFFRLNTDNRFSEDDIKEMTEELEKYQELIRLRILQRKNK